MTVLCILVNNSIIANKTRLEKKRREAKQRRALSYNEVIQMSLTKFFVQIILS